MKGNKNLYYLADVISTQTQIDKKTVQVFLIQFFREIERELIISSAVKIDNLGIFRVIKSLSGDRLLFLGKLASDSVSPRTTDVVPTETLHNEPSFADVELPETWSANHLKYEDDRSQGIQNRNNYEDAQAEEVGDENAERKQATKKKLLRKIKIFALFTVTILIVVGLIYGLYRNNTDAQEQEFSPFSLIFTELENNDTIRFSHIIKIVGPNADFYNLSKIYYLHEQFWPYIYNANEDVVASPFEIPEGTTIKIPKLESELIDYQNPLSVNKAKILVDKIMNLSPQSITDSAGRY